MASFLAIISVALACDPARKSGPSEAPLLILYHILPRVFWEHTIDIKEMLLLFAVTLISITEAWQSSKTTSGKFCYYG